MSLIQTLNQFQHLSPDEIVSKLNLSGWLRLREMTPEQFELLDQQECVVGAANMHNCIHDGTWIVSRRAGWIFRKVYWNTPTQIAGRSDFRFILREQWLLNPTYPNGDPWFEPS